MKNLLEILQNLPWPKIARIATPVLALLLVIYVVATPIGPVSGLLHRWHCNRGPRRLAGHIRCA